MSRWDDGSRWLRRPANAEAADIRLFCFHHAGGSASMFRHWPQVMPRSIEPIAVQLPGRGERFRERPFDRMAPLVDVLIEIVKPLLDRPFAFYGLSLGAKLSWALAHGLRDKSMPEPTALYLASTAAPAAERGPDDWKRDLVGYLRTMGGTPPEVFADPELLETVLPTLRADMTLADTFDWHASTPLNMPIRGFAGAEDAEGSPERMSPWRQETTGRFQLEVRPGGHFYDADAEQLLIRAIVDDLLGELRLPEHANVP